MFTLHIHPSFDSWRESARDLLAADVAPEQIVWIHSKQDTLFWDAKHSSIQPRRVFKIARSFLERARIVACHRSVDRWALLYRLAFRLTHGEPHVMQLVTDPDVRRFELMEKRVSRDRHKMTAFVRFRKSTADGMDWYIAWYRPDHFVVRLAADHFRERFSVINWSILTPDESVHWDGQKLCFSEGIPFPCGPDDDEVESLWLTYYRAIFNPARIKTAAMKREMPVRFWDQLPEADLIPELLKEAPARAQEMIRRSQNAAGMADSPSRKKPVSR